jgi:hypothetical protein
MCIIGFVMYVPAYIIWDSNNVMIFLPGGIPEPKNGFMLWYYKHLGLFMLVGVILILLGISGLLFYK